MKNNKGITLVALIVIIILLIIFSSVAIYTSMKSYEMIDLQKYKTQMQAIQNALDEFYEEYENFYKRNEDTFRNYKFASNENEYMELYLSYITSETDESFKEYATDSIEGINIENAYESINEDIIKWWKDYAPKYGITTDEPQVQRQYFGVSTTELESLLGLKDIDISEYFIINFQKRYVFSVTPIEINTTKNEDKTIYCLYELSEEEKIIEFKADNSSGKLEIEIIQKTLYYQIARVTLRGQETTIKQIYYDDGSNADNLPKVESKKEFFEEVKGLGTNEVLIKIKQNGSYKFVAEDANGGICSGEIAVFLSEPPVLENNMIPFKLSDNLEPIICDVNDSEWYNYTSNIDDSCLAAVILSDDSYNENIGKKISGLFNDTGADLYYYNTENEEDSSNNKSGFVVKLWIPYNKMSQIVEMGIAHSTNFINRTGIWVDAIWEDEKFKPVAHEHNWANLTCQTTEGTARSKCKRCGLIEYGIVKHDEIWVENPATCTASGSRVLKCSKCNNPEVILETIEIPALGHDWIKDSVIEATCLVNGSIEKHCSRCSTTGEDILYAIGHSYTSYTETAPSITGGRGYYTYACDNGCGETKKEWSNKNLVLNFNTFYVDDNGVTRSWYEVDENTGEEIGLIRTQYYNSDGCGLVREKRESVTGDEQYWYRLKISGTGNYGMACFDINLTDVNSITYSGWIHADSWTTNYTYIGLSNNYNNGASAFLTNSRNEHSKWFGSTSISGTFDLNDALNGVYNFKIVVDPDVGGDGTNAARTFLKQIIVKYN